MISQHFIHVRVVALNTVYSNASYYMSNPPSFTVRIHLTHLCSYNAQQIVQGNIGDQFKFTGQVDKVFSLICVKEINADINTEICTWFRHHQPG